MHVDEFENCSSSGFKSRINVSSTAFDIPHSVNAKKNIIQFLTIFCSEYIFDCLCLKQGHQINALI